MVADAVFPLKNKQFKLSAGINPIHSHQPASWESFKNSSGSGWVCHFVV